MTTVRSPIEEGIAADQCSTRINPLSESNDYADGPHAKRYRQIQALLDEPVGEKWSVYQEGDPNDASLRLRGIVQGKDLVASDLEPSEANAIVEAYNSLLAKYNSLRSEVKP